MFFSDLGVPPNLISGAERKRGREGGGVVEEEMSRMQRKTRGCRTKGKDERKEDEK